MTPFRMLFHVHTNASFDSMMSPRTILRYCRENGIHAVAICDHDAIRGSIEARGLAAAHDVLVIPAIEISTDAGDIIGLFVDRRPTSTDAVDVLRFIRETCKGLAVLPHPARGHDFDRIPLSQIDVIETGNARCSSHENAFAESLATDLGKPTIVGADAHVADELPNALNTFDVSALPEFVKADSDADARDEQLRAMLLTAPRRFSLKRSPARYSAMSRIIKGVKRRRLGTFLGGCQSLLREETQRRLWRFRRPVQAE